MQLRRLLLALQLSAVAVVAVPSPSSASVAPETGVRLYTGANYTGETLQFSPNKTHNTTLKLAHKDQISSLEVPAGFRVTLIDQDSEKPQSQTFDSGKYRSLGEAMDNQADIIVVSRATSRTTMPKTISDYPSFPQTYA